MDFILFVSVVKFTVHIIPKFNSFIRHNTKKKPLFLLFQVFLLSCFVM